MWGRGASGHRLLLLALLLPRQLQGRRLAALLPRQAVGGGLLRARLALLPALPEAGRGWRRGGDSRGRLKQAGRRWRALRLLLRQWLGRRSIGILLQLLLHGGSLGRLGEFEVAKIIVYSCSSSAGRWNALPSSMGGRGSAGGRLERRLAGPR